jgi:thioredoxin reductase
VAPCTWADPSAVAEEEDVVQVDAVVVGGGPAGLAAAGWLGRHRRRTVLVDAGEGRNRWSESMHGMPGSDTAPPRELRARVREEVSAYPTLELLDGRVTAARPSRDGFAVVVDGERELLARRLVLATGVRDVFPDIGGFFAHYGADVFHCPTCDGYEARDRVVAAIGWKPHIAGFAVSLLDWASGVVIVTDGRPLECDADVREALTAHGVQVHEERARRLLGERGALAGIELDGGTCVDCSMAFFSLEHEPITDLAEQLGCDLDDGGYVVVDGEGQTSVPGVYAAGDLTPGMQLVAVATGAGTVAGVACARSLQGEAPIPDAPPPAPDPEEILSGG